MLNRVLVVSAVSLLLATPAAAQDATPAATRVYGQPDFDANTVGHDADGLFFPIGLAEDGEGGLYVADRNNSRILYFADDGDASADRVYGQHDELDSYTQNYDGVGGSGLPSAETLNFPVAIALDADGGLYVTDRENHRVLYFEPGGDTTADRVYGQFGSFTSGVANNDGSGQSGAPSAENLNFPRGLALDGGGGLYVADRENHRVLYFAADGDTEADRVYGHDGGFASGAPNDDGDGDEGSPTADNLNRPPSVAVDEDGGLYVADRDNNRVLYFADDGDTTADWAFGQSGDFTSDAANNDGGGGSGEPSAENLNRPQFVLVGADGSLYVSDTGNNRVLVLPPDVLP